MPIFFTHGQASLLQHSEITDKTHLIYLAVHGIANLILIINSKLPVIFRLITAPAIFYSIKLPEKLQNDADRLLFESNSVNNVIEEYVATAPGKEDAATYELQEAYLKYCNNNNSVAQSTKTAALTFPKAVREKFNAQNVNSTRRNYGKIRSTTPIAKSTRQVLHFNRSKRQFFFILFYVNQQELFLLPDSIPLPPVICHLYGSGDR